MKETLDKVVNNMFIVRYKNMFCYKNIFYYFSCLYKSLILHLRGEQKKKLSSRRVGIMTILHVVFEGLF